MPLSHPPTAPERAPRDEQGHEQWFSQEVHAHDSSLKAYLRRSFPAVRDVEDIVQESYLRIWCRHVARPIVSAKGFLFQVARHLALDLVRHDRRSPFTPATELARFSVVEDKADVAERACINEEIAVLISAIDSLPERCREIFILRKLKGVSQREIAQQLDISEKTVEVQVGRANRRCEAFLRQHTVVGTKSL